MVRIAVRTLYDPATNTWQLTATRQPIPDRLAAFSVFLSDQVLLERMAPQRLRISRSGLSAWFLHQ